MRLQFQKYWKIISSLHCQSMHDSCVQLRLLHVAFKIAVAGCIVVYRGRHGVPRWALSLPRHSTFVQGFVPLASLLYSFQRASGDEKREEAVYRCDNSTYTWKIWKIVAEWDLWDDVL